MNNPVHSNRKLFGDNESNKPKIKGVPQARFNLNNKENNCGNTASKNNVAASPIPSVKGTWGNLNSPSASNKMLKLSSPDTAYYKSPFVLHPKNQNMKVSSLVTTPINGLKGSLIATST
mmetsp:Transcript_21618/g.19180  ORF Transcript_21618/g.19180 Transcript_21618/m.19180 type:complete len:119 (+) Transcript_21618:384-740(+)